MSASDENSLLSKILQQEITDFPELFDMGGGAPLAREGVAEPRDKAVAATLATVLKEKTITTVATDASGTVTVQYSHIIFGLFVFAILSIVAVTVIRKKYRQKTGFRNRRGHNILQQDSDEDDILISSMYS